MGFFSRTRDADADAPETATTAADEIRYLLGRAATQSIPAVVSCCNQGSICQARFAAATPDALVLELSVDSACPSLPPLSLCTVAFTFDGRSRVFLAPVLDVRAATGRFPTQFRLQMPEQIASAEGRLMFRAPVPPDCPLQAVLVTPAGLLKVQPLNLSLTGILVEAAASARELPNVNDEIKLRMRLGDETVELDAVVRRRSDRQMGLFFPGSMRRSGPDAPEGLRNIYKDLEGRYLRSKRQSPDDE